MSVQRAQFEITSTEFVDWVVYLDDEEINGFHREDYYLANIAAEVRRSYIKDPTKVRTESFLMKFKKKDEIERPVKMTREERTKRAKSFWGAVLKSPVRKK